MQLKRTGQSGRLPVVVVIAAIASATASHREISLERDGVGLVVPLVQANIYGLGEGSKSEDCENLHWVLLLI